MNLSRRDFVVGLASTTALTGLPAAASEPLAMDLYRVVDLPAGEVATFSSYVRREGGVWMRVEHAFRVPESGQYRISLRRLAEVAEGKMGHVPPDETFSARVAGKDLGPGTAVDLGDLRFAYARVQVDWTEPTRYVETYSPSNYLLHSEDHTRWDLD